MISCKKDPDTNRNALLKKASQSVNQRKDWSRQGFYNTKDSVCYRRQSSQHMPSAVFQPPPEVLSFSLNVAQDTLPHNANLAVWRKKDGHQMCASCTGCDNVLNQCPVSLHLRRYSTRHDTVLAVIKSSIMPLLSDADCLIADLHSYQQYIFPPISTQT